MVKILIIGDIKGHHRSQNFIHRLMQKDMGFGDNHLLAFANKGTYRIDFVSRSIYTKILQKGLNIITSFFFMMELFIKIPFCNKIYLLAMNHRLFPFVYLINLIWRKPLLTDMYISIYDAAHDRGVTNQNFFRKLSGMRFSWYLRMLDRMIIEKSNKIIYVGKKELQLVSEQVGADLTKANYVIIHPASPRKTIASPSQSTLFRVCWWGTFTPFHGVKNIIESAAILKKNHIQFRMDFFGTPQHDSSEYETMVDKEGLNNHVFFHRDKTFGNKKLETWLASNCDLALGNFSKTDRAFRAVPTKIIDALAMKLPVVTMDTEVLREYCDINNDLFVCNATPKSLSDFILSAIKDKSELDRRSRNGYQTYEEKFSPESVQNQFFSVVQSLK